MKYIKEYKVYESLPYSKINNSEYSELIGGIGSMSNRVPFGLSEKKILVDHLFFYQKHVSEFQIQFYIREDQNVFFYDIHKVDDEWFLVSELYRCFNSQGMFDDINSTHCWVKCDQFNGLLEFLKFKNIIK